MQAGTLAGQQSQDEKQSHHGMLRQSFALEPGATVVPDQLGDTVLIADSVAGASPSHFPELAAKNRPAAVIIPSVPQPVRTNRPLVRATSLRSRLTAGMSAQRSTVAPHVRPP